MKITRTAVRNNLIETNKTEANAECCVKGWFYMQRHVGCKTKKSIIKKISCWFSRQRCYNTMEERGIAVSGCCSGLVGGDKNTDYLQYECINCPYYIETT